MPGYHHHWVYLIIVLILIGIASIGLYYFFYRFAELPSLLTINQSSSTRELALPTLYLVKEGAQIPSPSLSKQTTENQITGKMVEISDTKISITTGTAIKEFSQSPSIKVAKLIYPTPTNGVLYEPIRMVLTSINEVKVGQDVILTISNGRMVDSLVIK